MLTTLNSIGIEKKKKSQSTLRLMRLCPLMDENVTPKRILLKLIRASCTSITAQPIYLACHIFEGLFLWLGKRDPVDCSVFAEYYLKLERS